MNCAVRFGPRARASGSIQRRLRRRWEPRGRRRPTLRRRHRPARCAPAVGASALTPTAPLHPPVPRHALDEGLLLFAESSVGPGGGELTHTLNVLEGGLRWTVTDVTAKLQIIEAGMGWGGLPEHVVASGLRDGTLTALTIREFDVAAIELSTLRRRDRPEGPVAQALWSRLRQERAQPAS